LEKADTNDHSGRWPHAKAKNNQPPPLPCRQNSYCWDKIDARDPHSNALESEALVFFFFRRPRRNGLFLGRDRGGAVSERILW